MTVDNSEASGLSYAGSSDGARESDRMGMAGVRMDDGALEACLDDGRCDGGTEDEMGCPWVELMETPRWWDGVAGVARRSGRSFAHNPKSAAEIRFESSPESSRTLKTRLASISATGRVMPVNRCVKKLTGACRKMSKELQAP